MSRGYLYPEYQVKNMIVSTAIAMLCASMATGDNREYCRAVLDMARVQVTHIDYAWEQVSAHIRAALTDAGRGDLLEQVGRLEG